MQKRWATGIINPFVKQLGPDRRIHEGWCPIFTGDACSCSDDDRRRRKRPPRPLSGGGASLSKKQLEDV
jgi:hypothetical protein